jgi:hypothetical protein
MVFSIVPPTVTIPTVVVLKTATLAVPVSGKKAFSIMMRTDPMCPTIGRSGPITGVPFVVTSSRIPIAVYPDEFGSWARRNSIHPYRRRWTYPDSHGNLGKQASNGQQYPSQQCFQATPQDTECTNVPRVSELTTGTWSYCASSASDAGVRTEGILARTLETRLASNHL